jgi:hypothetical protein
LKAICSITFFLFVFSFQLNSKAEIVAAGTAGNSWRVLVYNILSDEIQQAETAFGKLRNSSKSIIYTNIAGSRLTLVCHNEISSKHIEDYASKFKIQLRLDSDEVKDKNSIPELREQTKLLLPRPISRERFEALPAVKQQHILENPDSYTIIDE